MKRITAASLIDASYDEKFYHFEKAVKDKVGLFSDKTNTNRLHFICSEDLEHMKHLSQSPLFGSFILLGNEMLDPDETKAHLPDPQVGLVFVTTIGGAILGALGARWRNRQERREALSG